MNKEKNITVVIPNYNGSDYIENCLDSLLAGSWVPNIIVVDNASTDDSVSIIEKKYPMAVLLKLRANTGFCHAVNAGIHITRTPYVVLLNNDTTVDKECIKELYTAIVQNGHAFAAQAKMLSMKDPSVIDDAGDLYCALGWAFARGKAQTADKYSKKEKVFSACAGAAIYRMKVFEKIGLFDERHYCYLEDVDICYRARIFGYESIYAPAAVVYHAGSASSGSVHNPFKERMAAGNSSYLIYKNMPSFQYVINAPFIMLGRQVKRSYFHKKGLGEAYDEGISRGKYLRQRAEVRDAQIEYGIAPDKECIPVEACLEGADEELEKVYPLYLGSKVAFRIENLPNYLDIQKDLWVNMFKRFMK